MPLYRLHVRQWGGPHLPPAPPGEMLTPSLTQEGASTLGQGGGNQGRLPKGGDPEQSLRAEAYAARWRSFWGETRYTP